MLQSAKVPRWQSCRSIATNLGSTYELAFGRRCRYFAMPAPEKHAEVWHLAKEIHSYAPERIVFLSNEPHPSHLLIALKVAYRLSRLPDLFFHVYGDFPLGATEWGRLWGVLGDTPCLFIGASPRQRGLLNRLLRNPGNTAFFPFPVDEEKFRFDPKLRAKWRKRLGIGSDERVLLYSGRLNLQKNVCLLVQEAARLMRDDPLLRLWLVGGGDDIDGPLFGWKRDFADYEAAITRQLAELEPAIRSRIWRAGAVPHETLQGLYNAADAFTSFSLYHDEDYGMAAAEALLSGLPLALTRWGGYSQFVADRTDGALVPVSLGPNGLRIETDEARNALYAALGAKRRPKDREARAARARQQFGIEANTRALRGLHSAEVALFQGFAPAMNALTFQQHGGNRRLFPGGPGSTQLYEDLYASYYRPEA